MSVIIDVIEDVIDIAEDVVEVVVDVVVEVVVSVWDNLVMPLLEIIVGIFGIEDETVVTVQHISQKVYPSVIDIEEDLLVKIAIEYTKNPAIALISPFNKHSKIAQGKIDNYYKYAESGGYPYALPTTNIRTNTINQAAISSALLAVTGQSVNLITSVERFATKEEYFKFYLQSAYSYLPYTNTLTFTDSAGTFSNYVLTTITYNAGANNYLINVQRLEEVVKVQLSGHSEVTQGDTTLLYTVTSDRTVTFGNSIVVNLAYSGNAVNGTHYAGIASVTILEGTNSIDFTIDTLSVLSSGSVDMIVTINSITQTVFDVATVVSGKDSITTAITFDTAVPVLTDNTNMPSAVTNTLTSTITRPSYATKSYVIVTYYHTVQGEYFYWIYDKSTNVYPNVKMIINTLRNMNMMPIGILRSNFTTASVASIGETNYNGVVDLINTLDLDFTEIMTQVEANPQISSISEGFISFSVNPKDTDAVISKVLYEMFIVLVQQRLVDFNTTVNNKGYYATFEEQNVKRAVVWGTQQAQVQSQNIGAVGTYSHSVTNTNTLTLRKQVTSTSTSVVTLTNMSGIEFILGNGSEHMSLSKLGDDNFSILLSNFAVQQLTPLENAQLLTLALRFNFYSVNIQELEWYETSAFANLIQIALIIYTVITFDPTSMSLATVFQSALINYVVMQVAIAIISSIDSEFLKVIVAAGAAYLTVQMNSTGATGLSDASAITQGVTEFSNLITADIATDIAEIQTEIASINDQFDIRQQELQDLIDAQESGIDAFYLAHLKSPTTYMFMAGPIQYNFSSMYDYGTVVGNYHQNALTLGVI